MIQYPATGAMSWKAQVTKIHDGDTVTLDVDLQKSIRGNDQTLGFHLYIQNHRLHLHDSLRFFGINAPELSTPAGVLAQQALTVEMPVQSEVVLTTWLDQNDKYGRMLGRIVFNGTDINQWMIDSGHAVEWYGEGPKPV